MLGDKKSREFGILFFKGEKGRSIESFQQENINKVYIDNTAYHFHFM